MLNAIVHGWKAHFAAADRACEWLHVEHEHHVELAPGVVLAGRIDAIGRTADGRLFFGEWKTASPRGKKTWKQIWRMNPQSLTYGVLAQSLYPDCHRFTVRKAFKDAVPTFDHAWWEYSPEELQHWRSQLIAISKEIIAQTETPWQTNYSSCFEYGPNYVCPWFEPACSRLSWQGVPAGAVSRISHLDYERRLNEPKPLVLDATRIAVWLSCHERYRRTYEEGWDLLPTEAMQIGLDFHKELGEYYGSLIRANRG